MRKLFFLVVTVLFFGCGSSEDEKPSSANIRQLFVSTDANDLFVGVEMRLAVELEDTPSSGGWKFDFIVDGDVIGTVGADLDGSATLFQPFTPTTEGIHTYEGVLYNGKETVSKEISFEVNEGI